MKLLLDEQMSRKIARYFPDDIEIDTVQNKGWSGIENGELLTLAASNGYHASISADKNIEYQQSAADLPISVVVLHVRRLRIEDLAPLLPQAIDKLKILSSPEFVRVDE